MNPQKVSIATLAALSASIALADDFKTNDGKEYKNATVRRVEVDGIVVTTKGTLLKLYFTELPKDVQERFHYDSEKAAAAQTAALQASETFNRQFGEAYEQSESSGQNNKAGGAIFKYSQTT